MTLTFSNNTSGTLTYTRDGQSGTISFGFGHLECGIFPFYNQRYAASAAWLSPDTLYIKAHIIDAYVGSVRMEFAFGEDDVTVFLKKHEESLFKEFKGHLYGRRDSGIAL